MARDLELPITAPGAAATSASIAGVAKQVDNLGDESARAARQVDKLNDELAETDRKLKGLAASYAESGNQKFFKDMRELARTRASQKRALSFLVPDVPPSPPSPGGGGGLFGQALGSPLIPAAVGVGVLASPAIGAAINASILTGIGAAGIGAGIASAIRQDNAVQQEFTRLGRDLVSVFDDLGQPFVQPMRGAASFFRAELADVRDEWVESIGGMSDVVEPFARGISGFFRGFTPGATRGLEVAERVLDMFADKLPGLGEDVSTMMESFAQGGDGAVEAIDAMVEGLGDVLVVTGEVVEVLSKAFDLYTDWAAAVGQHAPLISGMWGPFLADADSAGPKIKAASDGFDLMGDEAEKAARDVEGLNEAMFGLLNKFLTMDELNLQVVQGLAAVKESIQENGTSLDINSEKGRANQEVLLAQIRTLNTIRQTNLDNNMSVARANQIYNEQYAALIKLASGMGVSRAALEAFLTKYNQLQSKTVTLTVRQVILAGGQKASVPVGGGMAFFADGGPIVGPGPQGVDSQLVVAAPGEYMLNTDMVDRFGGVAALERMRKGGSAFMSMPPAGGGGGGGTRTLQPIQLVLDGRVVHEVLVDLALARGQTPSQLWPASR